MQNKIQEDLKQAQLDRNELKVSTLRLLLSEVNNAKIQKGQELSDEEITGVIQKEIKKRKESIESFRKGAREDLALKEEAEAKVLESYLPTQLSDEELTKIIDLAINEVGANSIADMGKVIGKVMSQVSGKADGGRVSNLVKQKLSS
ncbi:GatB/YqeY domain-containing protein [Candidatus Daviesbacteria bacterium]|nr:GatB/YqeY domain-containing protein [Candidatus Daviesbacteria bacterium]